MDRLENVKCIKFSNTNFLTMFAKMLINIGNIKLLVNSWYCVIQFQFRIVFQDHQIIGA